MNDTAAPAATAARAVAGALVRHAITAAAAGMVSKGYVDQQTADSAIGPIADYALGAALAALSVGWGVFRAWVTHLRWVQAWLAPARPLPSATPPAGA